MGIFDGEANRSKLASLSASVSGDMGLPQRGHNLEGERCMGMALASEVRMSESNGHGSQFLRQYRSFPHLLWVVMQQHHGKLRPVAIKSGIAPTSIDRWIRGTSKIPEFRLIERFARAYGFTAREVWDLIIRDDELRNAGKAVYIPEWEARTGPPKGVQRVRRRGRYSR